MTLHLHTPGIAGLMGLLLTGITGCAPTDIKWTEEVKLHDGKVIQVKRRMELSATGFPTQKRGHPRYHELCFAPMGVYWKSKPEYKPEAFDIINGKAYTRVPLRGCTSCMLHDFPESNSIFFAWDGKQWNKLEESQVPHELRFNLLSSTHGDDDGSWDARGLITLVEKRKRDAGLYYVFERTGIKSLSERHSIRDYCKKCKGIDIRTDRAADVFLPSEKNTCA